MDIVEHSNEWTNPCRHHFLLGLDLVRAPYVHHAEDSDTVHATDLYEKVYKDDEKERLADNITNAMAGVSPETEERVYAYWLMITPARLQTRPMTTTL